MLLGVNVDHIATLRQARGTVYPSPMEGAQTAIQHGAHSITVHLREDRRHIQDTDVRDIRRTVQAPLNLEMALHDDIIAFALDVHPDEVCIVPERREELTTEGGLDAVEHKDKLQHTIRLMEQASIMVSLFIDPDPAQIDMAAQLGAPCIELHTGTFCDATGTKQQSELDRLKKAAVQAHERGLQVNAGHGINLDNISSIKQVPHLHTLNIGHSIIADAVIKGLGKAVEDMLNAMHNTE